MCRSVLTTASPVHCLFRLTTLSVFLTINQCLVFLIQQSLSWSFQKSVLKIDCPLVLHQLITFQVSLFQSLFCDCHFLSLGFMMMMMMMMMMCVCVLMTEESPKSTSSAPQSAPTPSPSEPTSESDDRSGMSFLWDTLKRAAMWSALMYFPAKEISFRYLNNNTSIYHQKRERGQKRELDSVFCCRSDTTVVM